MVYRLLQLLQVNLIDKQSAFLIQESSGFLSATLFSLALVGSCEFKISFKVIFISLKYMWWGSYAHTLRVSHQLNYLIIKY